MKLKHYLLFLIFLLLISCELKKIPVEGTWELISASWIVPDTIKFPNSDYDKEIKIIGEKHFLFIRQDTTNDNLFFSGGGTYSLKDNEFTETIEFTSMGNDIGHSIKYNCKFDGDIWIMTGPIKKEGEKEYGWQIYEKWKKIE